jgi:hypothetical protein
MAGKMLGRDQQSSILHTLHQCYHLGGHIAAVIAKGAGIDHRVGRIVIDIRHGCKIHMDPEPLHLPGDVLSQFVDQAVIRNSPQDHLGRVPDGVLKPHSESRLPVHGHQQGNLGSLLERVGHPGL